MKKYEYKEWEREDTGIDVEFMNTLGNEGWHFVQVEVYAGRHVVYYLAARVTNE